MTFRIHTRHQRHAPTNLADFLIKIRRFKKNSIIDTGTKYLWSEQDPNFAIDNQATTQLIKAYVPRIIILALATANDHRQNSLQAEQMADLCGHYLSIFDTLLFESFMDSEAAQIKDLLIDKLPPRYLQIEDIRNSCVELSIARLLRSQHETFRTNIEEFYRAYRIYEIWNQRENQRPSEICNTIFNIDALHFFKSGLMLFALANRAPQKGHLTLQNLTGTDTIFNEYQITVDTCRLVASKISIHESSLRDWYNQMVLEVPEFYQKFFPMPLLKYPLIHRDRGEPEINFLIPAPEYFVRGFINSFFSQLFDNNNMAGFGDAIEEYTYETICHIFGNENVSRIYDNNAHADFLIRNDEIDLIIEIKTTIGGYHDQSIMTPTALQRLWGSLYKASKQCAQSIATYKRQNHNILGIILVTDHITSEALPFLSLAERSGMFTDLNVTGIEILPWNAFEDALSQTSIENFIDAIKNKWINNQRHSAGDLLNFDVNRGVPAHQFEHLERVHNLFFPWNPRENR